MSKKYTTNFLEDTNGSTGTTNQVLVSTATGVDWVDGSGSGIIGGPYVTIATAQTITGAKTFSTVLTAPGGNSTEWNDAYDNKITTFTDSGTSTVTLTLTQQDGGTLSTSFSVPQGTVTGGPYLPLAGGTMTGNIAMGNNNITGLSQLAFTDNLRFDDLGADNYLRLTYGNTGPGGLQIYDGDNTLQGYLYADGGGTSSFGLLSGAGAWGVKVVEGANTSLYYNASQKLSTTNTGIDVTGTVAATGGNSTEWNTAYDNSITTLAFSGASTTTLTLNQQDGGIVSNTFINPQGTVVGATSGNTNTITVSASNTSPTVTAVTAAVDSGSSALATGAQIQTAINTALLGVLSYQGTWNASTNSPTLASGTGTPGYYYIVSVAGSTNLDGITDWAVGDWAVFSDLATDAWQKIDNTQVGNVTGSGANNRLAFWNSTSNISSDGNFTISGTRLIGTQLAIGDGTGGYFYSDIAGRTAFAHGQFYIQDTVGTYYNYATNQYHGNSSGDNHYFRGNPLSGDNWSITAAGQVTAASTITATGGFLVPYAAGTKKPMINLVGATNYGLWHTEAADDIFSFDFAGVSTQSFYQNGNVTFAGDLTVSGGDIILGGTGRIQGVDTVSATTDAANKLYVDDKTWNWNDITTGTPPTFNQNTTGSAATLTTARTLTIGATGKTFNGSVNVGWTLAEIGALPLAGGTMANTNLVTNMNADLLDGKDYTDFGATLATYGSTANASGRIRITAPFNTNSGKMFQITVSIYSGYTIHTYVVGGYMYSTTNNWYDPQAVYSGTGTPDIVVGRDSNGKAYISIANSNYTGVRVHNMTQGFYTSIADTYDPWAITIDGTTPNSVVPSVYKTWTNGNDGAGSGLDADLLDGQQGSYYVDTGTTQTIGGTKTFSNTISGSINGNAATATTFSTGRTNYKGVTDGAVAGQLMWKHYGNGHTIFDASASTSPDGGAVNNTNPGTAWSATYPTLMGWNGSSTYGVRVDSARYADNATTASNYLPLAGGVMTGNVKRSSAIVGFLEGSYNNVGANGTNTNPIYTIGSSYNPASTTLSNMYGVGFTSASASFITNTGATDWGFYVAADGDARVWLDGSSGNISGTGNIYASGGNSTEWNTAYDNRITSLTTTGTSGAATLISNVLNIPNYADGQGVTSVGGTAPIVSSGGTAPYISITAATAGAAGSMSATDKAKLDGIAAGAQVNVATNIAQGTRTTTTVPVTSSTGTNATLAAATTSLAGVMTSDDKTKLNGIATGAQVNVGTNLGITPGTTAGPIVTSSTGTSATLPTASSTASGVVTTGAQTWAGTKTFSSAISAPGGNSTEWNTAYDNSIVSAAVTGTSTKTLTLTQQDAGTVTASWTDEGNVTGTGATNYLTYWDTANTIANTGLYYDGQTGVNFLSYSTFAVGARFLYSGIDTYKIYNVNSYGGLAVYNETDVRFEMVFDGTGKIGIGTVVPDYTLDVSGDVGINDYVYHNGDPNTYIGFPAVDTFTITTTGVERLRVSSTGTLKLNNYGDGTITGTATKMLAVDTDGNVIEQTLPVTSVAATPGSGISITGSPITTSGTLTITNTDLGSSQAIFKNFAISGQQTIQAGTNADTLTFVNGTGITMTTNASTDAITVTNTDRGSGQAIFKNVAVSGQSTVEADTNNDTLTLATETGLKLLTNATTDTITYSPQMTVMVTSHMDHSTNNSASWYYLPFVGEVESTGTSLASSFVTPFAGYIRSITYSGAGNGSATSATTIKYQILNNGTVVYGPTSALSLGIGTSSGKNLQTSLSSSNATFTAGQRMSIQIQVPSPLYRAMFSIILQEN